MFDTLEGAGWDAGLIRKLIMCCISAVYKHQLPYAHMLPSFITNNNKTETLSHHKNPAKLQEYLDLSIHICIFSSFFLFFIQKRVNCDVAIR